MNILFITESFPYPLDSGGKIVSHQMLTMLSVKHNITLVALTDKKPTEKAHHAITSLGIKAALVVSKKRSPWYKPSKIELLRALLQGKPPAIYSFYEEMLTSKISSLLEKERFDIIHIEHLSMAQYLPKIKTTKWIFQEQNIEYKLCRDFYRTSRLFSKEQLLHFCNYLFLSWYERKIVKRVDQIIVLSQQDKSELIGIGVSPNKILVVPPYMKTVNNHTNSNKRNKELLFIGNLWWKPNLNAITWFLKKIFPLIQKASPQASLTIIGDGVSLLSSYNKNHPSITLLEKQKDISPHLRRASIFLLPFQIGQGVRIKALTAFSYGLPVVSTAVGMRGLQTDAEVEYLQANTPSQFAFQVLSLIHNSKFQKQIKNNADTYFKNFHNMRNIRHRLLKNYGKNNS